MQERRKWWASTVVSRVLLGLLMPTVGAALQLPPEIQADRYLLQAEKEIQEQDFEGAKQSLDRILELKSQHDLEIPEEFYFRYAEVVERLGLYDEAVESVTRYLTLAGRGGQHYRKALVGAAPIQWGERRRTRGGSTTCWGTCGSGRRTGTATIRAGP